MANLPPYQYLPGDIPEQLGRWLELARQCILNPENNADTGLIGSTQYLCRSVDLVRDNNAVAFADPDFALTLDPLSVFALEGALKFTGSTGGFRFNINGPIDGNFHWAVTDPGTSLTTEDNNQMIQDVAIPVLSGSMVVEFSGVIRTGSVPVFFNMDWAQETSSGVNLTLNQGSWIRLTRVKDTAITPPAPIVITILPATL